MDFLSRFDTTYLVLILTSAGTAAYAIGLVFSGRPWPMPAICLGLSLFWFRQASFFPPNIIIAISIIVAIGLGFIKQKDWAIKLLCLNLAVPMVLNIAISTINHQAATYEPRVWTPIFPLIVAALTAMLTSLAVNRLQRINRNRRP